MTIYLGTQGWSYRDWDGTFYPRGTRNSEYLSYYAGVFDAVELDTTFYGTPRRETVAGWYESTPGGFQFTAKMPKAVTHDRHLVDTESEVTEFLGVISGLEEKLGPILVQLPPDFTADAFPLLERFLTALPADFDFAVEFRHRSWHTDATVDLLKRCGICWTIIDLHYMPKRVELTADFSYLRWLGDHRSISRMNEVQIERRDDLDQWATTLDEIAQRAQRVYGFANNHYSGHSPADIRYLRAKLGMLNRDSPARPEQGTLL